MTTHENMGNLIARMRKARGLTQKELAERLGVTDKAVSKWERGLSCPDVTLLAPLAALLGVTADELLAGELAGETPEPLPDPPLRPEGGAFRRVFGGILTCMMLIAIAVCVICDRAINGRLGWSLYPVSSILFAFVVLLPVLRRGMKGVPGMLAALSLAIVPYLWVLNRLLGGRPLLLPIWILSVIVALGWLWAVFALRHRWEHRRLVAAGLALMLAVPVRLAAGYALRWLYGPSFGGWDIWDILLLFAGAALLAIALIRPQDGD